MVCKCGHVKTEHEYRRGECMKIQILDNEKIRCSCMIYSQASDTVIYK